MTDVQGSEKPLVPAVSKDDVAYASYRKIVRAHEHFQLLDKKLLDFWASDFYSVTEKKDANYLYPIIQVHVKPLPEDIPLIIGDVVHNLRSALDILWNTMVRRLGGDDTLSYFPIHEKREELAGALYKTDKVVVPAIPDIGKFLLDGIMLYKTGDPPGTNVVFYLNRLDRLDKHRLLFAIAEITGFSHITVIQKGSNANYFHNVIVRNGITEFNAAFPVEFESLQYGKPSTRIFFDVPDLFPNAAGAPITEGLIHMATVVRNIVLALSDAWRRSGRA